jgi:hypothetical protein
MTPFEMKPKMLTMGGAFYPTGYGVVTFPELAQAEQAAQQLEDALIKDPKILHMTPEIILRQLGGADGESDLPLPSVGTEGHSVQRYVDLARQGHHALMIYMPDDDDAQAVMEVLRQFPFSYAQKYHLLAIEDLE